MAVGCGIDWPGGGEIPVQEKVERPKCWNKEMMLGCGNAGMLE
jgi:hypothetical protein